MRHYDVIRGKKPTKTELILEYLLNRPNEVVSPKEVAEGLGFNLQTTVTVLNRLALEGAVSKMGRGQFCYDKGGKEKLREYGGVAGVDREKDIVTAIKMDKKNAATIYIAVYNMASESAGSEVVGSMTGLSLNDFDENAPLKSIQNLVRALIDLLGKDIVDDIVSIALENELAKEKITELKHLLKT
ncbi:MAG: hypothetical protein V3U20_06150 [Thermoplasmata archaeon]